MGLGQTVLTIMALVLLGRTIINVTTTTLDTGFAKDLAEYRLTGTSVGVSILEDMSANNGMRYFDERIINTSLDNTANPVTALSSTLGPDAGETSYELYDDIDDFNGYVKDVSDLTHSATYKDSVIVQYVNISSSGITVSTQPTWNKKVTVFVTSPYLKDYSTTWDPNLARPDTLKFTRIFSYWKFR